jgi:hypothetical protein
MPSTHALSASFAKNRSSLRFLQNFRQRRIFSCRPTFGMVLIPFWVGISFFHAGEFASAATTTDLKKEIEAKIVQVQQSAAPKLKVGPATCPDKLAGSPKKVPIGTYTCTVLIEGVSAPYTVVVKDGGFLKSGVYSISPAKAIIDLTKVVGFVRDNLDPKEASIAKITCGKGVVVVLEPNATIVCSVTVAASTQKYTFVVKDVNGTIALRSSPSGSSTTKPTSGTGADSAAVDTATDTTLPPNEATTTKKSSTKKSTKKKTK